VAELHAALDAAKLALFDEREAALRAAAEADELRAQEAVDRARIQQLLALTQPAEEEAVFYRDARPGAPLPGAGAAPGGGGAGAREPLPGREGFPIRPPLGAADAARNAGGPPPGGKSGGMSLAGEAGGDAAARAAVRDGLGLGAGAGVPPAAGAGARDAARVDALRRQLDDFRRLADERAGAYARDRAAAAERFARRADADAAALAATQDALAATQDKLAALTKGA